MIIIIFDIMLLLCFIGVLIGMVTDLYLFCKEIYKDESKKNKGFEKRGILHTKACGVSKGESYMDTWKLRTKY